ncbi:ribonuclease H-like domain-containing protein [Tanacetum coccineum]|uniref:Ribonuclease H-like domain-containing protein n=1 Tax=Tanacetum coccineum TaxID=301880 RepID=A0ABQ4WC97_9ASTR
MQFLMGLDDSYMKIRSSILSREVLPDVRSAYATISSEEPHRVAYAFVSNMPNIYNFQRNNQTINSGPIPNSLNNNRQGGGSALVCENCEYNGHTIKRCFKIIGYSADFSKKKSGQSFKGKNVSNNNSVMSCSSSGFPDEQMTTLISLIKDNKAGKNVQANMADNVLNISHLKIKVGHPNGTKAFISKIGNLKLSNGLILYDVLVILEYCVTLIYVHRLAKENKIIATFDESRCYFLNQDLSLENDLETSDQCEGLGHPAKSILNVLKYSLHIDNMDKCDLVHLDLWGPYKVTSSKGFRYFLTVMDDYTRAAWVYLIKSKYESDSNNSFVSGGGVNTSDFPVNNSGNDADSSDDIIAT